MLIQNEKYSRMIFNIIENINYTITITVNDIEMTYLMMGAYFGYSDFVRIMLTRKIDIEQKNNNVFGSGEKSRLAPVGKSQF